MHEEIAAAHKAIEEAAAAHHALAQKSRAFEELLQSYLEKGDAYASALKKERDAARQNALDVEQETAKTRHLYTREILGVQEQKLSTQKQVEGQYAQKLRALEKDAAEKEGLLAHFRTAAQEHHQRAAALEERLAARTLELHHLQKHERVKERYERHEKRAQKRKKK